MGIGYATLTYDPESIVTEGIGDLAACGYDGVEIGLPKIREIGRDRLVTVLDEHDIDLYCVMAGWLNEEADVREAVDGINVAADLGANFLGILPPPRGVVDDATFGEWLDDIGRAAADNNVTPVIHHHAGAHVEQPDEIQRWLDDGPTELQLLFDTGHYYAYGDVTDGIERFADNIAYVHYKDIAPPSDFDIHVENLSSGKVDYDSIMTYFGAFTDLGNGVLDFSRITRALDEINYDGHRTVEVDTVDGPTLVHAKRNLDSLRDAAERSAMSR
ncbi:sugar phosphate isomerase/epimerase [Natronococcus sp. A-GB1]|uniref:sugar phosphate isomerase/epimerase family protein n=1 Tax=Natronococcus sp. A-GB1 TaxID=3037648 RepID=UPI00241C01F7|nr:sugar phosphate isomerase/epimerase family protein [Natronococcus sp. A-GB1]MDG5761667.1 sugar phosphate isomerase/epimerase [Natronococcus sp. A-GB1]